MALGYTSEDNLKSGVHLGGLGTGTLQIFPDGTRGVFTGQNNWEKPLGQLHWFRSGTASDYRASNPFAVYVEADGKKVAKLLQTIPLDKCPTVERIEYKGEFPVAYLTFIDKDLPVKVQLTAFSPFINKDYKNSGLPVAIYTFKVDNPTDKEITVSLLASAINCNGNWNVGRYNQVVLNEQLAGINFLKKNPHPLDESAGIITLATSKKQGEVSYLGQWPYAGEPFKGNAENRRFDVWNYFSQDGTLPNTDDTREAFGEMDEWMGALAVKFNLPAGTSKEVDFYYSWYMPKHYWGHAYQKWFKNSFSVAEYALKKKEYLFKKTLEWQEQIKRSAIPPWLKDALINNLYVYTAASWWTKKNEFTLYENTVKWPLMDSLDVRYYGTIALAIFFPELEKITMRLFARAQRQDGRIPHDLGRRQINCPSDGTTAGAPWKDLSTKFALMVYRDYLWTKDMKFLKEMYPHLKRAMEWEFKTDKNNDCLPDNEGKDSTYDLWDFDGTNSYTSSIFLASLKACEKMALILKDNKFADTCAEWSTKGQKSFEEQLWNGSYYIMGRGHQNGNIYNNCILGQLNGQWYAHLLNLGYILPKEHVQKAVRTILDLNGRASKFGAVNSVFPDGRIDNSSYHAENIWVGESYAFACLAIYEGLVEEGMELAQRSWLHFVHTALNPWSQPDVLFAQDGQLGDGELYLRNLSIWGVPLALAKHKNHDLKKLLLNLEPNLNIIFPLGGLK